MIGARDAALLLASAALAIAGCASRTVVPDVDGARADASTIDASTIDAQSIDAPTAIDAPTSIDAREPIDAVVIADSPSAGDAPTTPDARVNRDAAGCLCPQGDACMSDGAILCAPHPDYPCMSADGWYAVCTETGWDCRFTTPAIC